MSLPRFLVPAIPDAGTIELPEAESHHACRVLRCSAGDLAQIFDGHGFCADVTFAEVSKRATTAVISSKRFAPLDHEGRLHFAIALPKGDRQRNTLEKLVELGVDSLTPLNTLRSVAVVDPSNLERLERFSIEASKQCGRNRLLQIQSTVSLDNFQWDPVSTSVWILHPYGKGESWTSVFEANHWYQKPENLPKRMMFMVGPEGGFVEQEVNALVERGARVLSFGSRILRVETAVATAAVLGSLWLK